MKLPRSGNSCMFGEKLVVLVGDSLPLFPLSEINRKSSFFLFSLCSELGSREQKEILGVILYIGNNWHLIRDGNLVWRLFFHRNTSNKKFKCCHLNCSLCHALQLLYSQTVLAVTRSALWNIQMPYAINMHASLRTLRFWEYLELFSHSDLIFAVSLNGFKTHWEIFLLINCIGFVLDLITCAENVR